MKTFLFSLSMVVITSLQAQIDSYQITNSDTLELPDLSLKRAVALHFDEATILLDHDLFMKHLTAERKGLKKKIKSLEGMIKQGGHTPGVTLLQLKSYQRQFVLVDSVFAIVKQSSLDTFHIDNNIFIKAGSPFGDFLPSTVENKKCMVLDLKNHLQKFVIKISGSKKTGQKTAVGSSFYFILGSTKYFLSKKDWVS